MYVCLCAVGTRNDIVNVAASIENARKKMMYLAYTQTLRRHTVHMHIRESDFGNVSVYDEIKRREKKTIQ